MVDYVHIAAVALKLVTKNGKDIQIGKLDATPGNAAKPWRGATIPRYADLQTVKAVEVPLSGIGKLINKADIPDGTKSFYLIAPGLTTPTLNEYDEIVDGEETFRLSTIQVLKPADVVLLYVAGIEK